MAWKAPNFHIWGFPKMRGTILNVLIIKTVIYWGLYWDPPILGNYHIFVGRQDHGWILHRTRVSIRNRISIDCLRLVSSRQQSSGYTSYIASDSCHAQARVALGASASLMPCSFGSLAPRSYWNLGLYGGRNAPT